MSAAIVAPQQQQLHQSLAVLVLMLNKCTVWLLLLLQVECGHTRP
jgi:hypothetical protein